MYLRDDRTLSRALKNLNDAIHIKGKVFNPKRGILQGLQTMVFVRNFEYVGE